MTDIQEGLTFLLDKDLYDQVGDIKVEFMENGYYVAPLNKAESDCSSCGSGCGH